MCDPLIAAGVMSAVQIAGTVASQVQASSAAKDQYKAAVEADAYNQAALTNRQQELVDKAQLDKFERRRQERREAAKIMVYAAEGNAVGQSVTDTLREAELGATYDINIMDESRRINARQTENERLRSRSRTISVINEANSRVPSAFTAGLQIAESGMSGAVTGYGMYQQWRGLEDAD